jgi:hypothetical protein
MASAQNPLLFIISEPVGSPMANEVAYRLADHGVRTFIGSLAPGGELKSTAMEALRASAAALLIFDEAAARSRHVDRHLLVARQGGKPLIPLRVEPTDEGLLRQELLDAQWIDGSVPEAAIAEISRRAFDYDRAQREQAGAGGAAQTVAPAAAAAGPGPVQAKRKPRIEVLRAGPGAAAPGEAAATAAPLPEQAPPQPAAARTGRSRFVSPTMVLAMLSLLAIVGAVLYNSSLFQGEGDRAERTVAEAPAPVDYPAEPERGDAAPVADQPGPAAEQEAAPPRIEVAVPPARIATRAEAGARGEPQEVAAADAPPAPPPAGEEAASGSSGVAAVRAFYGALSRGDGASAAQHVVPGKRQSGPLSGASLDRYFSSFRRPLRVRRLAPVDANTVRVAYDYVLGDGRLCRGEATVDVVESGGRGLVSGISTRGPC